MGSVNGGGVKKLVRILRRGPLGLVWHCDLLKPPNSSAPNNGFQATCFSHPHKWRLACLSFWLARDDFFDAVVQGVGFELLAQGVPVQVNP
jgi:hypothetical protein